MSVNWFDCLCFRLPENMVLDVIYHTRYEYFTNIPVQCYCTYILKLKKKTPREGLKSDKLSSETRTSPPPSTQRRCIRSKVRLSEYVVYGRRCCRYTLNELFNGIKVWAADCRQRRTKVVVVNSGKSNTFSLISANGAVRRRAKGLKFIPTTSIWSESAQRANAHKTVRRSAFSIPPHRFWRFPRSNKCVFQTGL